MSKVKEKMTELIHSQPEDATYDEIMRELTFERMVEKGMADSRAERVLSNDEMERRIRLSEYSRAETTLPLPPGRIS